MPCFFVNSTEWKTEKDTMNEYIRMFEYGHMNNPVTTEKFHAPVP